MWHFLIIISDTLTLLGIFTKISYLYLHVNLNLKIFSKFIINHLQDRGLIDLNICSIFLGIGCLCIWIGVLRYVGYFHQYNVSTIQHLIIHQEIFFTEIGAHFETSSSSCDEVYGLCFYIIFWFHVLWLDCSWTLSQKVQIVSLQMNRPII